MFPDPVVVDLDVLEDGDSGLLPCGAAVEFGQFPFQGLEEGFGTGIVPAVSFPAHTLTNLRAGQV